MRGLFSLLFCLFTSLSLLAQNSYEEYIDKYDRYAIEQMKRYGIPASITLAQGLLESGAGTSILARKANNHFGIKANNGWKGPYMRMDDDAPNEKFRVYRSAKASYEDHSKFLYGNKRYASLFKLSIRDYKGWARGLKKCGYATNPQYASRLIDIIERYKLARYDGNIMSRRYLRKERDKIQLSYPVQICNGASYILAHEGDTYKSLGRIFKKSSRKLRSYNEVDKKHEPAAGEIVYLEKKSSKADKMWKGYFHKIDPGESLHSISQKFGVRWKTLYKINFMKPEQRLVAGDLILIR